LLPTTATTGMRRCPTISAATPGVRCRLIAAAATTAAAAAFLLVACRRDVGQSDT
jgi:hypothetical protein